MLLVDGAMTMREWRRRRGTRDGILKSEREILNGKFNCSCTWVFSLPAGTVRVMNCKCCTYLPVTAV